MIGGAIDSADGDANNWLAVEGSANWHTILVAPEFGSYAFRAKIVLRDTDATKAAFNGIEAVPRETPDMTASGVLYGEETMKSAARPAYYSNVILVNAGANAANNGLEAVVSPSSSGAKGGDTVIVDAFAYGGSTSATPHGSFVELYVDRFEADEWVTLDARSRAARIPFPTATTITVRRL